ncbi:uncharacterized protein LOC114864983 [Betta splendens]|uniref:Uncharacterized protein LOC114864983 n=1 Tax=Betta splendens TaxID=158456 RepID=A0A9W2Y3G5_BETSP|nr:uncharacterized protein LOC114864983 [Betta splendens]
MVALWVTLLLLHPVYSLVPVITVDLNKPVTFTCVLPEGVLSSKPVLWYKQSVGEKLKLIAVLKSNKPLFEPDFSDGRLEANLNKKISNLTIQRATDEDEGMYHCAFVDWTVITWTGMYLTVKGNYSVVQRPMVSDPVRPGDSVTLQCSVLSASDNKSCPGGPSVYWFRAGSDQSPPGIISTDGNSECEQRSDSVKSCVYRFSKTISSSDAGTYRCAVATCGQILFGEGTKLRIEPNINSEFIALVILTVCLAISVTGHIVFICCRSPVCNHLKGSVSPQAAHATSSQQGQDINDLKHDVNYAALHFKDRKATRGRKIKEFKNEECVYSQTVNMVVLWVTLLLLHPVYSLVPVITVDLDKPVTFTCVLPEGELSSKPVLWYKQNIGDKLKLIAVLKSNKPVFEPDFADGRLEANLDKKISNLTIQRATNEDEGMYHCAFVDWTFITWTGMYLTVKGNYSVVQRPMVPDPVRPGDSVTLQCSVLSASDNKTCPGGPSVYWFRAGSDQSPPGIISTDGNSECEQRSDSVKSCVYRFSKTISSSDAGTYHCAVATCGQILFGEGTKLRIEPNINSEFIALVILTVCLAISVIGHIVFICCRSPVCNHLKGSVSPQVAHVTSSEPGQDINDLKHDVNYAALHFKDRKAARGRKIKEFKNEECVYSQVNIEHESV